MSVNANYFLLDNKHLIEISDDEAEILSAYDAIKCEAHIYNGLTYNYYYGGDCSLPVVTETDLSDGMQDKIKLDKINQRTGVAQSDLAGIYQDRLFNDGHGNETYLSGWTTEQIEDYSYLIQEGSPMYSKGAGHYSANKADGCRESDNTSAYKNLVATAEISAEIRFYDQAKYRLGSDNRLYFKFVGGTDSDIKYYVVPLSSLSALIEEDTSPNGYEWIKTGFRTYFLLGHYTSAATFNTDGEDVVVKLYDTLELFKYPRAVIPFNKYKEDGDSKIATVEYEEKAVNLSWSDLTPNKNNIGGYAAKIAEEFGYRVTFDKKRIVKDNDAIKTAMEFKTNSFTNIVENAIGSGVYIDPGFDSTTNPCGSGRNPKLCVVGVKRLEEGGTATENVYHIYMHPNRIYEVEKASNILLIYIDGVRSNAAVFGNYSGNCTCMILVHPDYDLTNFVIHNNWVWTDTRCTSAGTVSGMNAFTRKIYVSTNDSSDERRSVIDVGATGRDGTTSKGLVEWTQISVRQTKGTKEVEEGLEEAQNQIGEINEDISSINSDIDDINSDISGIHDTINNLPTGGGGGSSDTGGDGDGGTTPPHPADDTEIMEP